VAFVRPARIVLALLAVLAIVQVAVLGPRLPDPTASHFGLDGRADGWMPRGSFLVFYMVTIVVLTAMILGLSWLSRRLAGTMLNIPHRDRWLAPEHRDATLRFLASQMEWIAVVVLATFIGIFQLAAIANAATPARIAPAALWGLLAATVVGALVPALRIRIRFRRPPQDSAPPPRPAVRTT
jgi:uncharacterized membrane protein